MEYSRNAVRLMLAGVSQRDIARTLDCTPAAVSLWLRGARRPPAGLVPVIRALAGADVAEEIAGELDRIHGEPAHG